MNDFNELLFSFKEHLKVKNYSSASIAAYGEHLEGFFAHLAENNVADIKRVTRDVLQDYQRAILAHTSARTKGAYAVSTISLKVRAVKRFFEHLEATGRLLVNPAEHIQEPKKVRRLPRTVLTEAEARKVLDQPNLSTMTGLRDRTVLEVFYSTGIRLEELASLTIYDCDLQGGLLRVKGKFAKDRVVPLGRHAVRFLKEYITKVRPGLTKNNRQTRVLFMNRYCRPLSKQVIEIMTRDYAKAAGIKKRVTPHAFRHTFATELVRNGADLASVQKMLGHADLRATYIYTHVAGVDVKKTHGKSHPRERDKERGAAAVPRIRSITYKRARP